MIVKGSVVRCIRGKMSCITLHNQYIILEAGNRGTHQDYVTILDDYGNKKNYRISYFKEVQDTPEVAK